MIRDYYFLKNFKVFRFFFVTVLMLILIFNGCLFYKDLTPKTFWSALLYNIYGPQKPLSSQYVDYLEPEDLNGLVLVGHRGGIPEYIYPENSMNALRLASLLGVELFEVDVLLTKDNIPIIFHDIHLERLTGIDSFVSELMFSEIKNVKLRDGQNIPSLTEMITEFPSLLLDCTHNNINDIKIIINYLSENHLSIVQKTSYV